MSLPASFANQPAGREQSSSSVPANATPPWGPSNTDAVRTRQPLERASFSLVQTFFCRFFTSPASAAALSASSRVLRDVLGALLTRLAVLGADVVFLVASWLIQSLRTWKRAWQPLHLLGASSSWPDGRRRGLIVASS